LRIAGGLFSYLALRILSRRGGGIGFDWVCFEQCSLFIVRCSFV
jgi:hypothetical protein